MTDTLYRWVKASERLGEFHDSDIPSWKFFNPDFCRVQGQPVPQGWFRKDIESGATVFSYYYTAGANFTNEIKEDKFRQIEWLEPYTPSPTTADASVLKEALERIESAEVAEDQEFTFDPRDFIFQLKGIARKALAKYSTQSPSSIEESGLKEGEVRRKIICYCGSLRKALDAFKKVEYESVMKGEIALLPCCMFVDIEREYGAGSDYKIKADDLHKRKIDICDEVFVLNVGGYIGESTRSEIEYAEKISKPVKYLES